MKWYQKIKFDPQPGKVALVSGGSSGIGLAISKLLASSGMHVIILARNEERLNGALEEIKTHSTTTKQQIEYISTNVSDWALIKSVTDELEQRFGVPDLLVNSAGITHPGYVQDLEMDIFHEMIQVNYLGSVHLTKSLLPGMLKRGSGYIVNISSVSGKINLVGYSAYSPSKSALSSFSDALRMEMKPYGIGVSVVYPADTDTPQLAYENQFKPYETKKIAGIANVATPEQVAHATIQGIKKGNYEIFTATEGFILYHIYRLLGGLSYLALDWLLHNARNGKDNYRGQ